MKNNKTVVINTTFKDLMYYWLTFIKPFHNLSEQRMRILALLLYYYFEYKKKIDDDEIVWKMVFDYEVKIKITNELNVKLHTIENKLTELRKKKIINNNVINPNFIPNLTRDSDKFSINFNFKVTDDE